MKYSFCTFLVLLFICKPLAAQDSALPLQAIETNFKSFKYQEVITLSETIISQQNQYPDSILLPVLRMRTIAFYSLGDSRNAVNNYLEILRRQPDFRFDPLRTSPKIIDYFADIRKNFLERQSAVDSSSVLPPATIVNQPFPRGAMMRSLLLPGWGQLHQGNKTKGWIFATLGAASLTGAIYFAIDTRDKADRYLAITDPTRFDAAYDDYNAAYQKRNVLFAAFSLVWLYSQIDLLYITGNRSADSRENRQTKIFPLFTPQDSPAFGLGLTHSF